MTASAIPGDVTATIANCEPRPASGLARADPCGGERISSVRLDGRAGRESPERRLRETHEIAVREVHRLAMGARAEHRLGLAAQRIVYPQGNAEQLPDRRGGAPLAPPGGGREIPPGRRPGPPIAPQPAA